MELFRLIKQLDCLQDYSKLDVVREYELCDDEDEELILSKAIYPNGHQLGFYNYSNHDLSSLAKLHPQNIKDEFLDYLDSYSENILDIFEKYDLESTVLDLSDDELLEKIINLTNTDSNEFLARMYANILAKNANSNISFNTNLKDKYSEFIIACKLKQIRPDLNISFTETIDDFSDIFNFTKIKENFDFKIIDLVLSEDKNEFKDTLSDEHSSIITVSSSFFDENSYLLNNISNPTYLESIISLPIYNKKGNLMILTLNSVKKSNEFIYIDESESLIHKKDDYDFSFIENELLDEILNPYLNLNESQNASILPVSALVSKNYGSKVNLDKYKSQDDVAKRRVFKSEVDKLLEIQEQQASIMEEMQRHNLKTADTENQEIGFYSPSRLEELVYAKKRQPLENLLYKHEKPLLDEDVEFVNLSEIADLISINQKNDKDTILVAACKDCNSKLVYYNHDVESINFEDVYIEIDNISSDVSKQFLYTYLNSANGMNEIKYFSKKNHRITPEQLGFVKIPILKMTTQFELVDAVRESEEFFKSIELLKKDFQSNILDYKHVLESINELKGDIEFSDRGDVKVKKSMRHAYSDLIWPLASSYLQATKGGFEIVEKKENYLVLFEFVAAFNFIILLSGLPENVYQKCKWEIWNRKKIHIYKDMTFGKWVILSQNISKVYKKYNFTSKLEENLFNKISSSKILKLLDKTKDYRNKESHSAQSNKYESENILNELNVFLEDIFEILEVYSNYRFIYVLESNDLMHKVISLNGACAPPLYDTIKFNEKLENHRLYLYNPKNNNKLLIKDNFMKFTHVDENKKYWALFLYDGCDRNEYYASYKCYQSNENELKVNIYDFEEDIIG